MADGDPNHIRKKLGTQFGFQHDAVIWPHSERRPATIESFGTDDTCRGDRRCANGFHEFIGSDELAALARKKSENSEPAEVFIHLRGDKWRAKQENVFWLIHLSGEPHQNIAREYPAQGVAYYCVLPTGCRFSDEIHQPHLD